MFCLMYLLFTIPIIFSGFSIDLPVIGILLLLRSLKLSYYYIVRYLLHLLMLNTILLCYSSLRNLHHSKALIMLRLWNRILINSNRYSGIFKMRILTKNLFICSAKSKISKINAYSSVAAIEKYCLVFYYVISLTISLCFEHFLYRNSFSFKYYYILY